MSKYYFTYGSEGQPFVGGWTEIEAPAAKTACAIFRAFHPDRDEGFLNCCAYYTEAQFMATTMAKRGNLGARCHEKITVTRNIYT